MVLARVTATAQKKRVSSGVCSRLAGQGKRGFHAKTQRRKGRFRLAGRGETVVGSWRLAVGGKGGEEGGRLGLRAGFRLGLVDRAIDVAGDKAEKPAFWLWDDLGGRLRRSRPLESRDGLRGEISESVHPYESDYSRINCPRFIFSPCRRVSDSSSSTPLFEVYASGYLSVDAASYRSKGLFCQRDRRRSGIEII